MKIEMRTWQRRLVARLCVAVLAATSCCGAVFAAMDAATDAQPAAPAGAAASAPAPPACPPQASPPTPEEIDALRKAARDRGFLWRIVKNGRTSYLYGTIHVGRPAWMFPGPKVTQALREADTLALEIDLADPAVARDLADMRSPAATKGQAGPLPLPRELQRRLDTQLAAACLPPATLAAMSAQPPVMQAMTLTILAARWEGLDPAFAQELVLGAVAHSEHKRVVSLESVALQQQALLSAGEEAPLVQLSHMLDQLEDPRAPAIMARLGRAWEQSQLAEMADYAQWCACMETDADRAFARRVIDDRNPNLAQHIDAEHAKGGRVFAAVGALHMIGPKALPQLLQRRGFKVERIEFGAR